MGPGFEEWQEEKPGNQRGWAVGEKPVVGVGVR